MCGVVLLGMPGSGKSTIGRMMSMNYGYGYISSGDIARKMADNNEAIRTDLNMGRLAPEYRMRIAIGNQINDAIRRDMNFILDGFPRFEGQYCWLRNMFPNLRLVCVEIYVSEDNARYRCKKRARDDDKAISQRIDYYKENTMPLLKYCDFKVDNNGNRSDEWFAEVIHTEVIKRVNNR